MSNDETNKQLTDLLRGMSYDINVMNGTRRFFITEASIEDDELFYQDEQLQPIRLDTFAHVNKKVIFASDAAYINKTLLNKLDKVKKENVHLILNKQLNAIEVAEKDIGVICLNEI